MFTITEDHLKLLGHMYVEWNGSGYLGAPEINLKRPYGNSNVVGDLVEILYGEDEARRLTNDYEDDLPEDVEKRVMKIHEEMATVLQIVLATRSFTPGNYVKECSYSERSWKRTE